MVKAGNKGVQTLKRILLLSKNGKAKNTLMIYLMEAGGYEITAASSAASGRSMLMGSRFDLVIINTPLEDQFGDEAAVLASVKSDAGVIILIRNALVDNYAAEMERNGVMVVGKPVVKGILRQAILFAQVMKYRLRALQKENEKLSSRLDSVKTVNKAKWVLVEYLNMTEQQAHKYIEKQAMERRLTRMQVAEKILKTYRN